MKPKISVVVPVYNVEKYLEDCLDSVLNQTFQDFEVICINDGSTDLSGEILVSYEKRDKRVVVIKQANAGLSVARNVGIQHAQGEYICFLDSDDMLVVNALEKLWKGVEKDRPDIVNYETAFLLYEDESLRSNGSKDEYYKVRNDYSGLRMGRELFVKMVENNDFVESAWLLFIRTEWLREKGHLFCPGALFEDSVFAIECFFSCNRIKHIKEGLCIYRIRKNSIMTEKYAFRHLYYRVWQFSECLRAIYTYAENEREINALSKYAKASIDNIKYIYQCLDDEERKKVKELDALYGLIVRNLCLDTKLSCNKNLALEGLISEIEKSSNVILYGAGLIGAKVKSYLYYKNLDKKILAYAVSDVCEKDWLKDGISVKCISDFKVSDDIIVIISARESSHEEMVAMAIKAGFTKVYAIEYEMECLIDRYLEKKMLGEI